MSRVHLDGSPAIYRLKVAAHGAARRIRWLTQPDAYPAPLRDPVVACDHPIYSASVPLFRTDDAAEPRLERGKAHNVALAASKIHKLQICRDHSFSFWRAVGRLRKEDGFVAGLEIHGGCLVPSIGGGVCLLSNALFEMAARLGWDILERHGHTKEAVPPEGDIWGLDATVLYPYVDLRFAPRTGHAELRATVDETHLHLTAFADAPATERVELAQVYDRVADGFRENTVVQRRFDADSGRLLGEQVAARSRRQILHAAEQARTCFTCDETACPSRERFLARAR